jgi:hypothetical protein
MADTMSDDQKDIEIQKLKDQLWYMTTLNDNGRRFLADAQADGMKQLEEIGGLQAERDQAIRERDEARAESAANLAEWNAAEAGRVEQFRAASALSESLFKAIAERDALSVKIANEERRHEQTTSERDSAQDYADLLAAKIAGGETGEHSNVNNPWEQAIILSMDAAPKMTLVPQIRALSSKLEQARELVLRMDAFLAHLDFPYTEGIRGEFLRFLNNSAPSEAQREQQEEL